MVRAEPESIAANYDQTGRDSLINALEILQKAKFFEFLVSENNRLLVESYEDENPSELARKILDNRQTNRILLSIPTLIQTIKGVNSDA